MLLILPDTRDERKASCTGEEEGGERLAKSAKKGNVIFMNLPIQLEGFRKEKVWVNFIRQPRGGKITKPPITPFPDDKGELGYACIDDPSTWGTFDECNRNIGKTAFWHTIEGVGIILGEDTGLLGIDLDHVIKRDPNGKPHVAPEDRAIWEAVNGYKEVSISGDGVHILLLGKKPWWMTRTDGKELDRVNFPDGRVWEMYDKKRYFTFSGNVFRNCGPITYDVSGIEEVCRMFLKASGETVPQDLSSSLPPVQLAFSSPSTSLPSKRESKARTFDFEYRPRRNFWGTDEEAVALMQKDDKIRAFLHFSPGEDDSQVDYKVLAYISRMVGGDAERMRNVFSMLPRGQRSKWKDRTDYQNDTIYAVLSNYDAYVRRQKKEFKSPEEWKKEKLEKLNKK